MKPAKDIDTPKTKRCKTWEELKQEGTIIDGILYLPIGITTGNIPIENTESFKRDEINKLSNQYKSVNIEEYRNHEDKQSNLIENPFSEEEED